MATELKRILKRRRWTQAVLAQKLGVARNTVTRWAMGRHPIPPMAVKLIRHLTKEGPMKTLTIIFALLTILMFTGLAEAQTFCAQTGSFMTCDSYSGQSSTQTQLNRNMGTVTDSQGNLEPYAIFPSKPEPVRPLNDVLPRVDRTPQSQDNLFLGDGTTIMQPSSPIFVPYSFGGESQ